MKRAFECECGNLTASGQVGIGWVNKNGVGVPLCTECKRAMTPIRKGQKPKPDHRRENARHLIVRALYLIPTSRSEMRVVTELLEQAMGLLK